MSNLDRIISSSPINATAAKVANQSGCSNFFLNSERERLKTLVTYLESELLKAKPNSKLRKSLGKQKAELSLELHHLNKRDKESGRRQCQSELEHFKKIVRDAVPRATYVTWSREAQYLAAKEREDALAKLGSEQ
jgi:hypothetical protein